MGDINIKYHHSKASWLGFVIAQTYFVIWIWIAPRSVFYKLLLLFLLANILVSFGIALYSKRRIERSAQAPRAKVSVAICETVAILVFTAFGMFHPVIRYNMLKTACLSGRDKAVKLLLSAGTRTESVGDFTPLMIASSAGNEVIVRLLIEHNASVSARTSKGMTALDYARKWHNSGIEKLLLDANENKTL